MSWAKRPTDAPPGPLVGSPPTLEWIALDRLSVDERYQRSTESDKSARLIFSMVKCWDWRLCQPLVVSRREDGGLFVVDGQHRLAGARRRGDLPHLPCVVTQHENMAGEAETFVALNVRRQRLSQGDIFNASLAAGDPVAERALALIERAGLSLARHGNVTRWKPRQIFCAPMIQQAMKAIGDEPVANALVALGEAFPDKVVTNPSIVLKALFLIYAEDARQPGFDPDLFIEALASVDASADWEMLAQDARRANPSLSRREAMAVAFMETHDALRAERKAA